MTPAIQSSSPAANAITGRPLIRKSRVDADNNPSGQENSTAFLGENPCCATKPGKNTLSVKNNRAEFLRVFSMLYAGVYEIK